MGENGFFVRIRILTEARVLISEKKGNAEKVDIRKSRLYMRSLSPRSTYRKSGVFSAFHPRFTSCLAILFSVFHPQ